jgi:two-component system OmpR family response regulator
MLNLPKILLVEDDRSIAAALKQALQNSYHVDTVLTGRLALYKTDTETYDLIVLDLNLPDMPGLAVCQQLRERDIRAPILILTAVCEVMSKIKLLDSGANDYLTKPFSLGELKARIRALLRSGPPAAPRRFPGPMVAGELILDRRSFEVTRGEHHISLRRKEFALLECLMEHAGAAVPRQTLIHHAWPGTDDLWTNSIDVHIRHLRAKLDQTGETSVIETVHGVGYKLKIKQPAAAISK